MSCLGVVWIMVASAVLVSATIVTGILAYLAPAIRKLVLALADHFFMSARDLFPKERK